MSFSVPHRTARTHGGWQITKSDYAFQMSLRLDPNAVCDACGCFGAFRFETETLCADCYANRGSCCSAEFSGRPSDCKKVERADDPPPASPRHS